MPANLEVLYDLNEVNGDISLKLYKSTDEPAIGQLNLINVNAIAKAIKIDTPTSLLILSLFFILIIFLSIFHIYSIQAF